MSVYEKMLKERRIGFRMGWMTARGFLTEEGKKVKNLETLLICLRRQDEHRGARGA